MLLHTWLIVESLTKQKGPDSNSKDPWALNVCAQEGPVMIELAT